MTIKVAIAVVVCLIGWAYVAILKPPPTKICGTPGGPPVTSPRVRLSDGRHLAYKEAGVPKENAKYKVIIMHGYANSKDFNIFFSQEAIDNLKVYLLSFDRAGYGESDPHPKRSVKSEAFDIQELADILQIGDKFYVIGISMGGYPAWSCLKYIPHRLSGAALVVPVANFWWPSVPTSLSKETLSSIPMGDRWALRVAHYTPWLFNWWLTQKWFPSFSILEPNSPLFSNSDVEIFKKLMKIVSSLQVTNLKTRQQGDYESLVRDMIIGFGNWEFDPTEVANPFPNNEGSVHIWQGLEDIIIPCKLNRYISDKLPWIRYHEIAGIGHLLAYKGNYSDVILRELVLE
ncbi:uncharacterized protein LOC141692292 [Apium graveolens]|uniref:uncharacterized protein LOC141692292 n=1 Tax=Apium graveolens TaxID=4045 RepID=UPI003D795869